MSDMSDRNFRAMLEAKWAEGKFVCVGLDPDWDKIPESVKAHARSNTPAGYSSAMKTIASFCNDIVEATKDIVCAYKPNIAFFEAMFADGLWALAETVRYIHKVAPDVPVILDAKRADIGNTNAGYVRAAFEMLNVDAVTVHPYLGREALQPFLDCADKGIIVLCRTSNKGAGEFQELFVHICHEELLFLQEVKVAPWSAGVGGDTTSLCNHVAYQVSKYWNKNGNCALVIGATCPSELKSVRGIVGDMPILIPGIGAQGGDVEETVKAGMDSRGQGMIINSSRGIIFASSGSDFAAAARRETLKLHDEINKHRNTETDPR